MYYPVFLDLNQKRALVVGGGAVAQRKVETLLEHDASVSLVSRELTTRLKELAKKGKIRHLGSEFSEDHLEGMFLVIAATNDQMLNRRVSRCAQERGLLVNAVDQPQDCNFIVPSIMRRGDLQVAISTSGKSPALARKLRQEMELQFGEEYEKLLSLMGCIREVVLSRGMPQEKNKEIFKSIVESDMLDAIARKDRGRIEKILGSALGNQFDQGPVLEKILGSEGT